MNDKFDSDSLREEDIRINGQKSYCIFDSDSSFNIITLEFFNKLKYDKNLIEKIKKKVTLLNGDIIQFLGKIILNAEYRDKMHLNYFYIVKNSILNLILGNNMINKLENMR